jgi:RNA polymerase sigma factor (TIGR02999 family)
MGAEPFVAVSTTGHDVLVQLRTGGRESIDRLVPLLYEELRAMAHRRLLAQPRGGTLQTTALVHEAYLKIIDQSRATVRDRVHFLALASLAMRHVLVDRAKARGAVKRDGQRWCVTLDEEEIGIDDQPRLARVVECRFFGALTEDEIAEALGVNVRTVQRDWAKARMLLRRTLGS